MYKKRFAKWGFYKNVRRTHPGFTGGHRPAERCSTVSTVSVKSQCAAKNLDTLSFAPSLSVSEAAALIFLTNIQTWSSTFYELTDLPDHAWSIDSNAPPPPLVLYSAKMVKEYDPERLSFSFRVVVELLERGEGVLAGRLARKAFLQTEALLQVEGPLFVWNILEILYYMALRGQTRLFEMLLRYLIGLARSYYPDTHPVIQVLQSLRALRQAWIEDSKPLQVATLEQGWELNANILFSKFDSRFLFLYYRLVWDSSILKLPQHRLRDADRWFALLEVKFPADDSFLKALTRPFRPDTDDLGVRDGIELPKNYDRLRSDAVEEILDRSTLDFQNPVMRIRVLSGLLKSRILNNKIPILRSPADMAAYTPQNLADILRLHARVLAYVMKVLMEVDCQTAHGRELAADRLRSIIALRKYGKTPKDPQIVYELWQLEELLLNGNRPYEAAAAQREAYELLDEYLSDVPADMVYMPVCE